MSAVEQDPRVIEDLSKYAGSWVAVRGGRVVATAPDSVVLREKAEVHDGDLLMPVPEAGASTFLL